LPALTKKWYPLVIIFSIIVGSYFYILHSPWTPQWLDGKEFWYQLFWKGEKVGFVQIKYHLNDDKMLRVSQLTRVKTINRGEEIAFTEKEILNFDISNAGDLKSTFYQRDQDTYSEQTYLERIDGNLIGEKQIGPNITKVTLGNKNYFLSEFLALMRWSGKNLAVGDTITARRLDLGELTLNPVTYEVLEKVQTTKNLRIGFHEATRSWDGTVELSEQGKPIRYNVGQLVEQQLSTKEQALKVYSPTDYYISQVIGIDKPLGDLAALNQIVISTSLVPDYGFVSDQRQYIGKGGDLHITNNVFEKKFNKNDYDAIVGKEKSSLEPKVQKELLGLAETVVANSKNTQEKVTRLLNFVSGYLVDTPVTSPMTVETILAQRKGDCTEHTQLFIALLRALSIPAREAEGLVYLGDEIQGFGGHVWSEVVIDNYWVAVDPTWNLSGLTATHIQVDPEHKNNIFDIMHKDSSLSFSLKEATYNHSPRPSVGYD